MVKEREKLEVHSASYPQNTVWGGTEPDWDRDVYLLVRIRILFIIIIALSLLIPSIPIEMEAAQPSNRRRFHLLDGLPYLRYK